MFNFSQLESCGIIEQRINIHAQEDVYSMTKVKVTEFQKHEEQTKKQFENIRFCWGKTFLFFLNRTKEIGRNKPLV